MVPVLVLLLKPPFGLVGLPLVGEVLFPLLLKPPFGLVGLPLAGVPLFPFVVFCPLELLALLTPLVPFVVALALFILFVVGRPVEFGRLTFAFGGPLPNDGLAESSGAKPVLLKPEELGAADGTVPDVAEGGVPADAPLADVPDVPVDVDEFAEFGEFWLFALAWLCNVELVTGWLDMLNPRGASTITPLLLSI